MYDAKLYEKMQCSMDKKKEVLGTLDKLLQLAGKAKELGLLSLEPDMDSVRPELFKKSIQLLIDGFEPETLREVLLNFTLCSNYKGKELFERILIIEGISAIQEGIDPLVLKEKLSSLFGEDFIFELEKHFGTDADSMSNIIDTYINRNQNKPVYSKETSLLEKPLSIIDNRSLQRLLREIDNYTLAMGISGASGGIETRIIKSVSGWLALVLISELNAIKTPVTAEITESQKRIIEVMHSLRNQGEIII